MKMTPFWTAVAMYGIAMVAMLIGIILLSNGLLGGGMSLLVIGIIYAAAWNRYTKEQRKKRMMRDAYIEAQEKLNKK
jgi:hypothetical protein